MQKDVFFVSSKVDDEETESYLRQKLAEEGIEPLGAIRRDRSITRAWLKGEAIAGKEVAGDAYEVVNNLEASARVRSFAAA